MPLVGASVHCQTPAELQSPIGPARAQRAPMPIQISVRTWLALLALALAIYAAIPLLPIVGSVATLLFFTTLLVLLINPLAMRLEQRGIKRRLTVAGVLLLVLVIALLVVLAIMPVLANSFGGLADQIQRFIPELQASITSATGSASLGDHSASAVGFVAALLAASRRHGRQPASAAWRAVLRAVRDGDARLHLRRRSARR